MRVIGAFDLESFTCDDLESPVHQLAVLLFPPDLFNERFLTIVRNCLLKLEEGHPVKKWLKHVASGEKPTSKEQARHDFAVEMLNSPFNLITDQKVKNSVIDLITVLPRVSVSEKIFAAYLYLMIGNITRSDNIIREVITATPRQNLAGFNAEKSVYHRLATSNLDKIFSKFSRHPADRRTFELLDQYILNFMNAPELMKLASSTKTGNLTGKYELAYVKKISPFLVSFLHLQEMSKERRVLSLRNIDLWPLDAQAQWLWPFVEMETPLTDEVMAELKKLEATDPLWLIYLLDDERLADFYLKKGGTMTISAKRTYLRNSLKGEDFMLALLKLVGFGDIDKELVEKTATFLSDE